MIISTDGPLNLSTRPGTATRASIATKLSSVSRELDEIYATCDKERLFDDLFLDHLTRLSNACRRDAALAVSFAADPSYNLID